MRTSSVQMQDQDDKTWVTKEDAARILEIGSNTMETYLSQNRFRRQGSGNATRVHLGDVRNYDRDRRRRKRATNRPDIEIISAKEFESIPEREAKDPLALREGPPTGPTAQFPTTNDVRIRAQSELDRLNDRMTLILTRKAELEEALLAIDILERFTNLSAEGVDE